jgi:hypothetical protein
MTEHGFCSHLGQGYLFPVEQARAMQSLGATVLRDDVFWHVVEPTAGAVLVGPDSGDPRIDDLYKTVAEHKRIGHPLKLLLVFAYGNDAHPTNILSYDWRAAYANYVVKTLQGFLAFGVHPGDIYPVVLNEPNAPQFGMGFENNGAAYAELCRFTRWRVKRLDSRIRLIGGEAVNGSWGGVGWGYWPWWDQVFSDGNDWCDIVSFHEYHGHFPALGPYDLLFNRASGLMEYLRPMMRAEQTFALTESGVPGEDDPNLPRWIELLDNMGVEFVTHYALRDHAGQDFQFLNQDMSRRLKAERFAATMSLR